MTTNLPSSANRIAHLLGAALLGAALIGCASVKLPAPSASAEVVQTLRTANLAPAKAGTFALAAGKPSSMDTSVGGLRGSSLAPESGSFSKYLKDQIVADLTAAGLYDEGSTTVIDAQLTDSRVDAAMGTGTGRLAAHFTVQRNSRLVFDKDLAVDAQWESSFVGAVALPAAINQYAAFYKALSAKLFNDVDFRKAVSR